MMNKWLMGLCTSLITLSTGLQARDAALEQSALAVVRQFAGQLKPALKNAMAEGGPVRAVNVCAERAPAIAASLSAQTGWRVSRVSLKPRNGQTARPDAWERAQLQRFARQRAAGAQPASLKVGETVDGHYRFMKAQVVEPLCLNCHGTDLTPAVAQVLARHYPEDRASGYRLGEIRGAFSLSRPLEAVK